MAKITYRNIKNYFLGKVSELTLGQPADMSYERGRPNRPFMRPGTPRKLKLLDKVATVTSSNNF